MSENNQKRKIIVSEKTYEKISQPLKDKLINEGFEIEVVSNEKFKEKLKKELKDIYVFKEEECIERIDLQFTNRDDYSYSDKIFPTKKQKMYVPKTIGKPNSKKRGER